MNAVPQRVTVQQVLQRHHQASANPHVDRVVRRIKGCRTAACRYHLYRCDGDGCGRYRYRYHSCGDRHCPGCGAMQQDRWVEERRRELLPIPYYHVVFTLPHELNGLVMGNRRELLGLLFAASAQALLAFAGDERHLGAMPGIISVLHTWGQQLSFHPHVHCIVGGGGIAGGRWKAPARKGGSFLFPVRAMGTVYRAKFLQGLRRAVAKGKVALPAGMDLQALIDRLYRKQWVVYAKKPFGGPDQVIGYLGRYTHKVAIGNGRILSMDGDRVTFAYKDYGDGGKQKQTTLAGSEFVRRFEQHILPRGLTKIRSYGYLANRGRTARMAGITASMGLPPHPPKVAIPWEARALERYGIRNDMCPHCNRPTLVLVQVRHKGQRADDG